MVNIFSRTHELTVLKTIKKDPNYKEDLVELLQRVQSLAFKPIPEGDTQITTSTGWIPQESMGDVQFTEHGVFYDAPYLRLSIRKDTKRIAETTKALHIKEREKAFRESNPTTVLLKEKKAAIKEAVVADLLGKTIPTPTIVDLVWNMNTNILYLLSASNTWLDELQNLFTVTFPEWDLKLVTPYDLYEQQTPNVPKASQPESYLDKVAGFKWLGEEFFQWLACKTSIDGDVPIAGISTNSLLGNPQTIPAAGLEFSCTTERKLLLVDEQDKRQYIRLTNGSEEELKSAFLCHKKIKQGIIAIQQMSSDCSWNLSTIGDTFRFLAFRSPPVKIEKGEDETVDRQNSFYIKMSFIEEGFQLFLVLFNNYVLERTTNWQQHQTTFEDWIEA